MLLLARRQGQLRTKGCDPGRAGAIARPSTAPIRPSATASTAGAGKASGRTCSKALSGGASLFGFAAIDSSSVKAHR
jgi:hypothetical protein